MNMNSNTPILNKERYIFLLIALLLVASSLRAPITGVGPILEQLRLVFGLSPSAAGLLTTLPLIAFAVISPFTARFSIKFGFERILFASLIVVIAGAVVRSIGSATMLFIGTSIIGIGIAIGNVLVPSLVKRDFPNSVPVVTGLCSIAMAVAGAFASSSVVPLAQILGWQPTLMVIAIFSFIACLFWIPLILQNKTQEQAQIPLAETHSQNIWKSKLAWQVTLFMGCNAALFYAMVSWLPAILTEAGYSNKASGSLHGLMQLAGIVPGLILGPLVNRLKDQRFVAISMGLLMCIGMLGLLFVPHWATLWVLSFGIGSGGGILLALMFLSLRSRSVHQAAALSGMAQGGGYLMAAACPTLVGALRGVSDNWNSVLMMAVLLSILIGILGYLSGRNRYI